MPTRSWFSLAFAAVLVLTAANCASAGVLLNGDFSTDLTGWTTVPDGNASVVGGEAQIAEHPTEQQVDLFQDFDLPLSATTLSFILESFVEDLDDGLTEAFNASLLDPVTLVSLVDVVAGSDAFFARDLVAAGTGHGQAATGVSLSGGLDDIPLTITLDVSAFAGQTVRLNFRLLNGGDESLASVNVDDVLLDSDDTNNPPVIPEPASAILFGLSLLICAGYHRLPN